jgi:hypothetical protein
MVLGKLMPMAILEAWSNDNFRTHVKLRGSYMKKIISSSIVAIGLFSQQFLQAQGTMTYLSNLGQPTVGTNAVGSDSWLAAGFYTGTNAGGYLLDSIQLGMANASGNPTNFTVMLYSLLPTS